eukprot:TRINITY_DN68312_c0_g1_i1.p1 TRINITY_DN68312_c0_g1~~TRINITY_DN68312_c0_g1_i1.p1  ORF type:complete len:676 (+),score=127.00 TRINITY_DN68312_c0_g1_i1:61-2028(+)
MAADLPVTLESSIKDIYLSFCNDQTAGGTSAAFDMLLEKSALQDLKGQGLRLFVELKQKMSAAGLNFKQMKLLQDLEKTIHKVQLAVATVRGAPNQSASETLKETIERGASDASGFNEILVCGAGPVGLRAACECALMGFNVRVIEKRPNFSRANILTFWDQTMADMLGLGAKSYFPNLVTAGDQQFLGTRQIQACLVKTLLLLGASVRFGMEICGLLPPDASCGKKWRGLFRPYVKHRRTNHVQADLTLSEKEAPAAPEGGDASSTAEGKNDQAADSAVDFQKQKDYATGEKGREQWEVDRSFLNASLSNSSDGADINQEETESLEFDAYMIAEGGWSDSTGKLGFDKVVENFQACFGLVINMKYNQDDETERNMKSKIAFTLSGDFPLHNCPIRCEFVEYLKGETHFFALVVMKKNPVPTEKAEAYLKQAEESGTAESVLEQMRFSQTRKGLIEMGVFKEDKRTGQEILKPENVDVGRLQEMAREIVTEMGLPPTAEFFDTNPVQLFDFSRRARCVHPVKVLRGGAGGQGLPEIVDPEGFCSMAGEAHPPGTEGSAALVLPVGDALQEPNWTQGLGVNRGFHTAMNQAFACLLGREKGIKAAVEESVAGHKCVINMKWGMGNSGLAGSGGGNIGLKPVKEWNSDPRTRLPFKS